MPPHPGQEPKAPSAAAQSVPLTWRGLGIAANSSVQPACLKESARAYLSDVCTEAGNINTSGGYKGGNGARAPLALAKSRALHVPSSDPRKSSRSPSSTVPILQRRKLRLRLRKGHKVTEWALESPRTGSRTPILTPIPLVFFLLCHWVFIFFFFIRRMMDICR